MPIREFHKRLRTLRKAPRPIPKWALKTRLLFFFLRRNTLHLRLTPDSFNGKTVPGRTFGPRVKEVGKHTSHPNTDTQPEKKSTSRQAGKILSRLDSRAPSWRAVLFCAFYLERKLLTGTEQMKQLHHPKHTFGVTPII